MDYKKTNQFREKFAYIKNELLAVQGALEYFLSGELMVRVNVVDTSIPSNAV